jgi:hypothetical protein
MTHQRIIAALAATFMSASLLAASPSHACGYSPFDFPASPMDFASSVVGKTLGSLTTIVSKVELAADQQSAVVTAYDRALNRHVSVRVHAGTIDPDRWTIEELTVVHGDADDIAIMLRSNWNRSAKVERVFFSRNSARVTCAIDGANGTRKFTVKVSKNAAGVWSVLSSARD